MENLEQHFSENLLLTTSRHETQSSKSVREYSDPPIPIDILIEIFSLVPAKSIARFRCVSKLWAAILGRPDFTELFLTKSLTLPRIFFTFHTHGKSFFYSTPQPRNPDDNSSLVATPYHTSFPNYFPYDFCQTVCGLVLLQGFDKKFRVICNPATGEFLTLPKVPKVKARSKPSEIEDMYLGYEFPPVTFSKFRLLAEISPKKSKPKEIAGMYLGYDPIGKQFKLLCMTLSRAKRPNTHQVLTLESGKKRLWRTVERKFHFVENYRIIGEICINGVLYFSAAFRTYSVIVCFDVRSEKLGFINTDIACSMPGKFPHAENYFKLLNYKGKLGMHHYEYYSSKGIVLWVLEDAGNHKWSKHIKVLPPLEKSIVEQSRFVGTTGTGEIVYSFYPRPSDHQLLFYNLEREDFTSVHIQGLKEFKSDHIFLEMHLDYVENVKSFM